MICYIINRSSHVALEGKALEEMWAGKSVDYFDLKVYDCSCFIYIHDIQWYKLDSKLRECLFLRFKKSVKCFKLWDATPKHVIISMDVILDEECILKLG